MRVLQENYAEDGDLHETVGIKRDSEVLDPANREDRILVTFDKDFGELIVRERRRLKD